MRDYRIGCDAHKRYSQLEVQDDRGRVLRQARVFHAPGAIRVFFSQFPHGTPVALESVGNWYWIADEIEAAGCVPLLTHPARAKVMMGHVNKTDKRNVSTVLRQLPLEFSVAQARPEVAQARASGPGGQHHRSAD